jgi:hypothetical protein
MYLISAGQIADDPFWRCTYPKQDGQTLLKFHIPEGD